MSDYKLQERESRPVVVNGEQVSPGKKAKAAEKPIDIDAIIREKRDEAKNTK